MDDDICTIPDCDRPKLARGWCSKHYQRWEKHGDANYTPAGSRVRAGSKPVQLVTVGQRIGRWVVVDPEVRVYGGRRGARVRCSCPRGTEKEIALADLLSGNSKSCGCLRGEATSQRNREANPAITHGMSGHPMFQTWTHMLRRCQNPSDKSWPSYGGRGIRVCVRWNDIRLFVEDIESSIGPRPAGRWPNGRPLYSIDRIDNDGNYEPGNVQWATTLVQNRNRRIRPWRRCACGNSNPGWAKFCLECGSALPAA
jgi:hypothetical protein